jgi:uncharacterized protein (DUF2267 family)
MYFIDRLMRDGIPDRATAERAARATLATLGERLTEEEARGVADALPGALARTLRDASYDSDFDDAELYERVRRREGAPAGAAREHAQVVLRALGEVIDDDVRTRVTRALPRSVAELLEPRAPVEAPPHAEAAHAPPITTLAAGKPGSRHPIAEARPDLAHSHSVAREDNPHGETKLSSARGLTQERLGDAIAAARPGPARPISEASDGAESPDSAP